MKNLLTYLIFLIATVGCNPNESDIKKFTTSEISFNEMPTIVQNEIKRYCAPRISFSETGDTLKNYDVNDPLICLDINITNCEFKVVWGKIVSAWLDHEEIILDDKIISIEQANHKYNAPFIIYQNHLYCKEDMDAIDIRDPSKNKYRVLDLSKFLIKQ
jgi:hypothetical protein